MPCLGINCIKDGKPVTKMQCLNCQKICPEFPLVLRKAFFAPNFRHKPPQISVTSICGCLRSAFFKLTTDYFIDVKGLIAMNVGTAVHKMVEPVSRISEQFIDWETPKGNKIIGFIDALTIDGDLYDLKTTTALEYKKKEDGEDKDSLQLNVYATILKKRYGLELNSVKLLYLNLTRDRMMWEKEVDYKDMTDFINKRTDVLQECIDKNIAPPGKPLFDWECRYCLWTKDCPFIKDSKL